MFRTRRTLWIALLVLAPFGGCAATHGSLVALDADRIQSFRPADRTEVDLDVAPARGVDVGLVIDMDEAAGQARGARGGARLTSRCAGLRTGTTITGGLTVDAMVGIGLSTLEGSRIEDVDGGAGIAAAGPMIGGSVGYAFSDRFRICGQLKRVDGAGGGFATSMTAADLCIELEPFENTALIAGWRATRFDASGADRRGVGLVVQGAILGFDCSF